jgi:hypothetical protein
MSILSDLSALPKFDRIADELTKCRFALESIATSLQRATELPAAPVIEKKIGVKDIGNYAQAVVSEEDAEKVRDGLHAAGLRDSDIEAQIVAMMAGDDQEPTE